MFIFNSCMPAHAEQKSWGQLISNVFDGTTNTVIALGSTIGACALACWYWSPKKVQQRKEEQHACAVRAAKKLYPKQIAPLAACWDVALEEDAAWAEEIAAYGQPIVTEDGALTEREQRHNITLEKKKKPYRAARRVVLYVMHQTGREIAENSRGILGASDEWLKMWQIQRAHFFKHPHIREQFKSNVNKILASIEELKNPYQVKSSYMKIWRKMIGQKQYQQKAEKYANRSELDIRMFGGANYRD